MTNLRLIEVSGDIPDDGHCFQIVDDDIKDRTFIAASFHGKEDAELFLRMKRAAAPSGESPKQPVQLYLSSDDMYKVSAEDAKNWFYECIFVLAADIGAYPGEIPEIPSHD